MIPKDAPTINQNKCLNSKQSDPIDKSGISFLAMLLWVRNPLCL